MAKMNIGGGASVTPINASEPKVEDQEFTEEETKNQLMMSEDDIIAGMLEAHNDIEGNTRIIDISRYGKKLFEFKVHGLTEAETDACRKKYTKYIRNKQIGTKVEDHVDGVKFRSSLIYHATTEDSRASTWDNKKLWKALNASGATIVTALDVIDAVLLSGEKDRVMDVISDLSGYNVEDSEESEKKMVETAKN